MRPNNNVTEGSSLRLQAEASDINGEPMLPSSARFKVCDWETTEELLAWTELEPALLMILVIPPEINRFKIGDIYYSEHRAVTIEVIDSTGNVKTDEIHYRIKDLKGI